MDCKVVLDWKFALALGGVAVGLIFATKLDSSAIKEVSLNAVDAYKEYALTCNK